MIRIPRVCLVLVVTALLALLTAPVVGARTVSAPPAHETGWLGAALHWVQNLVGQRSHGHRGPSVQRKDGTYQPAGGTCIDPVGGRPLPPWCA
ncbi:MAG TPA: hypothetical protein VGM86_16330 [Thermoanaerobaculia bacterium]